MGNTRLSFESEKFYHVYNHGNANDNIFINDGNYQYFLNKFNKYVSPIAETFAYCLLPNHFHFLIQIKSENIINDFYSKSRKVIISRKVSENLRDSPKNISDIISRQFANFFNSYTKSFNKQNNRKGSLFLDNFNRKNIDTEDYLKRIIIYIHQNPVNHGFSDYVNKWKYSSYNSIISDKSTKLKRDDVISLFDDVDNFIYCHSVDFYI